MKDKLNNLSVFVKFRRKQIQLTQIELAEKAGVGLALYSRSGTRKIKFTDR
jgi:transcriptional regulator with XRE-family HTH domain